MIPNTPAMEFMRRFTGEAEEGFYDIIYKGRIVQAKLKRAEAEKLAEQMGDGYQAAPAL